MDGVEEAVLDNFDSIFDQLEEEEDRGYKAVVVYDERPTGEKVWEIRARRFGKDRYVTLVPARTVNSTDPLLCTQDEAQKIGDKLVGAVSRWPSLDATSSLKRHDTPAGRRKL